ncbi:hypothetical protein [Martelella radicis]|uniref:Uncharacterized protein n=1 Tax=Martelella radicis TaxID=1397476 RepID=A0A7W6KMC5_9HYPH|nr:hypothetical protein [Martelella radicis]MBB4123966.1 hypothetical protein [Martelella radicis]
MALNYNKKNLLYLLLCANLYKGRSGFVSGLVNYCNDIVDKHNKFKNTGDAKGKISRSIFYNYFSEIDEISGNYNIEDTIDLANRISINYIDLSQKYMNKFNDLIFLSLYNYLESNGFIHIDAGIRSIEGVNDPLFFSLSSFLDVTVSDVGNDESLVGTFAVLRPSLRAPGKAIVSCAKIRIGALGVMHYEEIMHYRFWGASWVRQYFQGYALHRNGKYTIITKDDNTKHIQVSYLNVKQRSSFNSVDALAGSYNGFSPHAASGIFSSGIVIYRAKSLAKLDRYDLKKWRCGLSPSFGLVSLEAIDPQIRKYLALRVPES